jgi:hypothetical protein
VDILLVDDCVCARFSERVRYNQIEHLLLASCFYVVVWLGRFIFQIRDQVQT